MFNLVKWAYNLGVKHERDRIAAYLTVTQDHHMQHISDIDYRRSITSEKDYKTINAKEDEIRLAVDNSIIAIIRGIFRQNDEYKRGQSVMFPEGEK